MNLRAAKLSNTNQDIPSDSLVIYCVRCHKQMNVISWNTLTDVAICNTRYCPKNHQPVCVPLGSCGMTRPLLSLRHQREIIEAEMDHLLDIGRDPDFLIGKKHALDVLKNLQQRIEKIRVEVLNNDKKACSQEDSSSPLYLQSEEDLCESIVQNLDTGSGAEESEVLQ